MTWDGLAAEGVVQRDVTLADHTTYRLGGPARFYASVDDAAMLSRLGRCLGEEPLPVLVLGRGSNLLVSDSGFPGLVIHLGPTFARWSVQPDGVARAGGAMSLPRLARALAAEGRGGLEWGVGVPGSVGGAVRQNAGCFGFEVVDVLVDAEVCSLQDGSVGLRRVEELDLSYRHSNLVPTDVVTGAGFNTHPVEPEAAMEEMRSMTRWRKDNQPGGTLNAGSVFKNPPGETAGEIIDRLGLKGFSVGGVRVSPRHANFIEAEAGSSAADVRCLIEAVRDRVFEQSGIRLETEIQMVGFGREEA